MSRFLVYFTMVFGFCGMATATDYYVAPAGNDANTGTSPSQAWRTLQRAANVVSPGDQVLVADGSYAGFTLDRAGTLGQRIEFRALGDGLDVTSGSNRDRIELYLAHYVTLDGFRVSGATRSGIAVLGEPDDEVTGVTIRNCRCSNNGTWGIFTGYAREVTLENNECAFSGTQHGIYVSNSADYPVIRFNVCHHNACSGIQINADPSLDGDGIISHARVESNVCYGNGAVGGAALNFASVRDSLICNNELYGNTAGGIALWDDGYGSGMGCRDNRICNNTVRQAPGGRWAFNMINGSTGNLVCNNIFLSDAGGGARGGIETDSSSLPGLVSDHNVMVQASLDDTLLSLAAWRTASGGRDLQSFSATAAQLFGEGLAPKAGSPAIDAGIVLPDVPADFLGSCRPMGTSTDIGAREFYQTPFTRFSADTFTDLLWREAASGDTVIWDLGAGLSVVGGAFLARVAPEWGISATADFDRDGVTDLLWRHAGTGDNAVWFLDASGPSVVVASTAPFPTVDPQWRVSAAADLNRDGKADLVWRHTGTGDLAAWFLDGIAVTGSAPIARVATTWDLAGVADFNHDACPDLFWRNTATGDNAVWYLVGTSPASAVSFQPVPVSWDLATLGDFNGDGNADLLWRNRTTGDNAVWFLGGIAVKGTGRIQPVATNWLVCN